MIFIRVDLSGTSNFFWRHSASKCSK